MCRALYDADRSQTISEGFPFSLRGASDAFLIDFVLISSRIRLSFQANLYIQIKEKRSLLLSNSKAQLCGEQKYAAK